MKYFIFKEKGSEAYIPIGLVTFAIASNDSPIFAIKCDSLFYKTKTFKSINEFRIFKKGLLNFTESENSCGRFTIDFDEEGWSDVV